MHYLQFHAYSLSDRPLLSDHLIPFNFSGPYLAIAPPRWCSSYGTRLLTQRSGDRILAAADAFLMKAGMFEAHVLKFRCTLKISGWSKFTEPSTTASLKWYRGFGGVKPLIKPLLSAAIGQVGKFWRSVSIVRASATKIKALVVALKWTERACTQ